jgi:hypothetical protein
MHALNDRLTDDQISELVGLDLYNDFVTDRLTEVMDTPLESLNVALI